MNLKTIKNKFSLFLKQFDKDDIKLLMQFLELIVEEYNKNSSKLFDFLTDDPHQQMSGGHDGTGDCVPISYDTNSANLNSEQQKSDKYLASQKSSQIGSNEKEESINRTTNESKSNTKSTPLTPPPPSINLNANSETRKSNESSYSANNINNLNNRKRVSSDQSPSRHGADKQANTKLISTNGKTSSPNKKRILSSTLADQLNTSNSKTSTSISTQCLKASSSSSSSSSKLQTKEPLATTTTSITTTLSTNNDKAIKREPVSPSRLDPKSTESNTATSSSNSNAKEKVTNKDKSQTHISRALSFSPVSKSRKTTNESAATNSNDQTTNDNDKTEESNKAVESSSTMTPTSSTSKSLSSSQSRSNSPTSKTTLASVDKNSIASNNEPPSQSKLIQQTKPTACMVCEEIGTGNHYGAFTCNSCRDFFKRAITIKFKFECVFDEDCLINRENRLKCRRCRLIKCFRAGMKPCDMDAELELEYIAHLPNDLKSLTESSIDENNNSQKGQARASTKTNNQLKQCLICTDTATGYFYGVTACTSCAKFFSRYRSSQSHTNLQCQYENQCELNAIDRKKCSKCRFEKYKMLIEKVIEENTYVDKRCRAYRLNKTLC